jgi:hypothetical protein
VFDILFPEADPDGDQVLAAVAKDGEHNKFWIVHI